MLEELLHDLNDSSNDFEITVVSTNNSSLPKDKINKISSKLDVNITEITENKYSKNALKSFKKQDFSGIILPIHPEKTEKYFPLIRLIKKEFIPPLFTYNNLDGYQKITRWNYFKLFTKYLIESLELERFTPFRKLYYFGLKHKCPVCHSKLRKFNPHGTKKLPRPNAKCPVCNSMDRQRLLWLYLKNFTDFFNKNLKLLHFAAPEKIYNLLKSHEKIDYYPVDFKKRRSDLQLDIQKIPLEDNCFDYIWCSHVLEHVKDDQKALRELYRVLKPGGTAIILIPINAEKTEEFIHLNTPKQRLEKTGHHDHYRNYGFDFKKRLVDSGFKVQDLKAKDVFSSEELEKIQCDESEIIYFCSK